MESEVRNMDRGESMKESEMVGKYRERDEGHID